MEEAYSLSQITSAIELALSSNFESSFSIKAEVASFSQSSRGHVYFEFVEKSNNVTLAKMRGNMWRNNASYNLNNFREINGRGIRVGDELLFMAKVEFHTLYGISLVVESINAEFTLGKREKEKKEILKRLEREGLLVKNKELTLEEPIKSVAIISSKNAAGYQDLITHLKQNNYGYVYDIQLFESIMQGETAPHTIVKAFENVNKNSHLFQVVVLTRGGGADLDLDCFSTYEVCKALANCSLPVITGIGHERDTTTSDLCAHTPVKTPTAVADLIIDMSLVFEGKINTLLNQITNESLNYFRIKTNEVQNILQEFLSITKDKGVEERETLKNLIFKIANSSGHILIKNKNVLLGKEERIIETSKNKTHNELNILERITNNIVEKSKLRLNENGLALKNYETQLDLASPKKILKRGFAYIKRDNTIIKRGKSLKKKDKISIYFLDTNKNAEIK